MVLDLVVYHPTYAKLLRFFDSGPRREKSFRLVAYLSRFLAYYAQRQGYPLSTVTKFISLKTNATFMRKGLRFLKPLNHLEIAAKLYDNKNVEFRWANIIRNLCLAGYLTLDSVVWFKMMGLVDAKKLPNIAKHATYLWLFSLIAGLVNGLQKLASYNSYQLNNENEDKAKGVELQLYQTRRKLLWDALDTFIALNLTGYLHFTEGDIGFAGTITSIMGLNDLWTTA